MTAPTLQGSNSSSETAQTTTHTISLPSGIGTSGRLVVVKVSYSVTSTTFSSWTSGWTAFGQDEQTAGGTNGLIFAYHYTTGSEGYADDGTDTITVTTDTSCRSAHHSRVWSGAENPSTQAPEVTTAIAANDAGDPPSISPTGGSKDYAFAVIEAASLDGGTIGYPTNYSTSQLYTTTGGTNAAHSHISSAIRTATTATEDPSSFSCDDSSQQEVVAGTLAIHPTGGGGGGDTNPGWYQSKGGWW